MEALPLQWLRPSRGPEGGSGADPQVPLPQNLTSVTRRNHRGVLLETYKMCVLS